MNYKIILNEDLLRDFIDNFLPDIDNTHTFYVSLLARRKYDSTNVVTNDKQQLKRFNSDKKRLFDKIWQLEAPLGSYKTHKGESIPNEALALYIAPNPKSLRKASQDTLIELSDGIYKGRYDNPRQVAMTAIHNAYSKFYYRNFDMDNVESDVVIEDVLKFVNKEAVHFLKTRGGVHVIVESAKVIDEYKKSWFKNIYNLPYTDKNASSGGNHDFLLPVIGTNQGGFMPHFINI